MPLLGTRGAASARGFGRFGGGAGLFAFTSQVFTPTSGVTSGNDYNFYTGPSYANAQAAYAGTTFIGSTANFTVSGNGVQEFTIPVTGTYRITAVGASGGAGVGDDNQFTDASSNRGASGGGTGAYGGYGASMRGDFSLLQGEILALVVGQCGRRGTGNSNCGGGGGGGTFVYKKSDQTLLIAAGGGGGNNGASGENPTNSRGTTGTTGTSGYNAGSPGSGGGAGTSYGGGGGTYNGAGGAGWNGSASYSSGSGSDGNNGGKGLSGGWLGGIPVNNRTVGGFGGGGGAADDGRNTYSHGSGGGGGYSGGGGAYYTGYAGGGGSYNNGTTQSNTTGANGPAAHGSVTIAFIA
jgi:hypothetical protein